MRADTLAHLSDAALLRDLALLIAQDRLTTATLLAHLAEVDARRLYLPAGYPSMHAYCVEELGLSEDAASRRIQAARAARQFPVLLGSLAEGRLHLTAVCLLAPHLTSENLEELVEGASRRRKAEVQEMLARRFPLLWDSPAVVRALGPAAPSPICQHALSMKTGCQESTYDPSARGRRSPAVYSGSGLLPQVSLRRAGSHTAQRASRLKRMPGSPARVQRRLRYGRIGYVSSLPP